MPSARAGTWRTPPNGRGRIGMPTEETFTTSPGCGYTRKVDVFKPVIAAVNGYAQCGKFATKLSSCRRESCLRNTGFPLASQP